MKMSQKASTALQTKWTAQDTARLLEVLTSEKEKNQTNKGFRRASMNKVAQALGGTEEAGTKPKDSAMCLTHWNGVSALLFCCVQQSLIG